MSFLEAHGRGVGVPGHEFDTTNALHPDFIEIQITDPEKIRRYVSAARFFHPPTDAVGIPDPPLVVATENGARIMTWVPDNGDLTAAEVEEPRVLISSNSGLLTRAWLLVDDEDLWE